MLVEITAQRFGVGGIACVGIGDQRSQWAAGRIDRHDIRDQRVERDGANLLGQLPGLRQHSVEAAPNARQRFVGVVDAAAVGGAAHLVALLRANAVDQTRVPIVR